MNRAAAEAEIKRIFKAYRTAQPTDSALLQALADGKLYELFVLSYVVENLANRGFNLVFVGSSLKFKASPGKIKATDPHFEISAPGALGMAYWLFVDIEFDTFGHSKNPTTDNSRRHEIDIVVVSVNSGYPSHQDIALGVECKAVAYFSKGLLKEALGVRRELGILTPDTASTLSSAGGIPFVKVPMDPPSEYWLAFTDSKGTNYSQSPSTFGIELRHIEP